ncbi:MAG TPA: ParA family protein [Anaerolineaceae bacterium]|nr:ParA family protein [Anaerolineaceae bacterium]
MTYKIAIANEKGGVAKTTTTISLGAALAENGNKVLLVDLDAQANLSLALGLEASKTSKTIANILMESASINSCIHETSITGLDIIPSNGEMGMAERFLPIKLNFEEIIRKVLQVGNPLNDYQFVIMDCPPFIGAVTTNALVASDLLLVPTQAEYFSIYSLRNLMGIVRRIRSQYNPHLTYRLLLTMVDRRNRTHRTLCDQLRASFNTGVFETVINIDTKLRESPIAGIPITNHAPKSRAALEYRALAQELLEYVQETTLQPAR